MSADIARRASFTGSSARRQAPPPMPGPRPAPELSAEAKRLDLADNDLFEKNAAENAVPTDTRPALITSAEVQQLRVRFSTGAARLDALTKCTRWRYDFYLREAQQSEPFTPLTQAQEQDARQFFEKHGARLKGDKALAPENPIKARERAEQATPPAQPDRAAGATAAPSPAREEQPAAPASPVETPKPAADLALLAEVKALRGDVAGLRQVLELIAAQLAQAPAPAAAQPAAPAPAPITYELKEGESFREFNAETITVGVDEKTGGPTYRAKGHPYLRFGVRIFPEVMAELGLDPAELKTGPNQLPRRVRMRVVVDAEGNPKKVVGLA